MSSEKPTVKPAEELTEKQTVKPTEELTETPVSVSDWHVWIACLTATVYCTGTNREAGGAGGEPGGGAGGEAGGE